jgi:phosphatidylinositol glycan class B
LRLTKRLNRLRYLVNSCLPLTARSPYIFQFLFLFITLFSIYFLSSIYSLGYYHGDEHFQIIEFMSYKLGLIPKESLPWEFKERLRPWLAPFLYFQITKIAEAFGVNSHFTQAFLFRFVTMFFGIITLLYIGYNSRYALSKKRFRPVILWLIGLTFFMPMFIVRISSENLSALSFWSGASLLLYTIKKKQTVGNFLFVGILFGLAFQFRYQIAFMLFGACLWALVIERVKILRMSVLMFGFFIISGMGILIDKWGYGEWTFAPYNYFYANLIEKKADLFGVLPWDGYFTLFFLEFYTLPGLFLLSAISIFCFMFYKHFYSWCILPFLLVHFYIGHKETRFLFPILYISIPILYIMFESIYKISNNIFKEMLKSLVMTLLILNFLFLPYFVFMPPERNMKVIKFINENFPDIKTVFYNINDPFKARGFIPLYFYTPQGLKTQKTINLTKTLEKENQILYVKYSIATPEISKEISEFCKLEYETPSFDIFPNQIIPKLNQIRNLVFYGTFQVFTCQKNLK